MWGAEGVWGAGGREPSGEGAARAEAESAGGSEPAGDSGKRARGGGVCREVRRPSCPHAPTPSALYLGKVASPLPAGVLGSGPPPAPPPFRLRLGRPRPGYALRAAPALAAGAGGRSGRWAPGRTADSAGRRHQGDPRDFLPAGWLECATGVRALSAGLRQLVDSPGAGRGRSPDSFLY